METNYKKASFASRFLAYLIDSIIVWVALIFVSKLIPLPSVFQTLVNIVAFIIYGAFFISYKGATPGKMLLKIKVVSLSYEKVSFGKAFIRELSKILSGLIFNLGYFWVLIDKRSQSWHDKIAKTFVVKLEQNSLVPIPKDEPVTLRRKIGFAVAFLLFGFPLILIISFLIIYIFIFRPFAISGNAMNPNYLNGQYYVATLNYRNINRGDVFVFKAPHDPEKDFIKRVIGLPGDTIQLRNGDVYVNGQLLDETNYRTIGKTYGGDFLKENKLITVPNDEYFVLGDNRMYSSDSRVWGFVPKGDFIGEISFCYYNCVK